MQLNIKVIKKWQTPISTSTNPFQGYPPFLAKFLVPLRWLNFLKVLPCPPLKKGGGVVPTIIMLDILEGHSFKKRCILSHQTTRLIYQILFFKNLFTVVLKKNIKPKKCAWDILFQLLDLAKIIFLCFLCHWKNHTLFD